MPCGGQFTYGDVEDGVHAGDPSRAGEGECVGLDGPIFGVVAVVAVVRGFLDAGEDHEEENSEAHCGSCGIVLVR